MLEEAMSMFRFYLSQKIDVELSDHLVISYLLCKYGEVSHIEEYIRERGINDSFVSEVKGTTRC